MASSASLRSTVDVDNNMPAYGVGDAKHGGDGEEKDVPRRVEDHAGMDDVEDRNNVAANVVGQVVGADKRTKKVERNRA